LCEGLEVFFFHCYLSFPLEGANDRQLHRKDYSLDIAEVLAIHPIMLYRWKKEYRDGDIMKKPEQGTLDSKSSKSRGQCT